jgi:UDP-N-acetylglucosamine pyrophosphorylase
MRANFINSLEGRFEHPGMTTMSQNRQQLISVHLMNSVLNNRDLSTTVPAMVEQYIRMFQDSDFIQDLFQTIKNVHGKNIHPERMIKLAVDYVTGKLQATERH